MAQFSSYLAPTVTTDVVYEQGGVPLFGDARIPVLIGEGAETRTLPGIEMHRGSSAVADDLRVGEDLTAQVDGLTRTFTLTYGPVVRGDGTGTIATDPAAITAYTLDSQLNKVPLRVVSLNGSLRQFQLQDLLTEGSSLKVTYHFKRTDTKIVDEDLSDQIPTYASLTVQGISFTLTQPGFSGNKVSLAFTKAATAAGGKSDVVAVSGIGTDVLSIELMKPNGTLRTSDDMITLALQGIQTKSGGQLVYSGPTIGTPVVLNTQALTAFTGGSGQNTNRTFKMRNVPVVDGTNGGRVTNLPSKIVATVNGKPVSVSALDGASGLFTLAAGVTSVDRLKVTYYTNTYQDSFDILPTANAIKILNAGYAPGRADFEDGTDFLLGDDGNIYWGNAAVLKAGKTTNGYLPFDASAVQTSLVDEKVHLRPCTGPVDGMNAAFTLQDMPCDGSGLGSVTDNPFLVSVYVGTSPRTAYAAGPVKVTRLTGRRALVVLADPPTAPSNVYATYWRNIMGNHKFTASVVAPGGPGVGSYRIKDQVENTLPRLAVSATDLADAAAAITGLVWPGGKADLRGVAGKSPEELVTLTFQDDGATVTVPALQAQNAASLPGVMFQAVTPGVGPNSADPAAPDVLKPALQIVSQAAVPDSGAITVTGQLITININSDSSDPARQVRTLGEIVDLVNASAVTDTTNMLGGLTATLLQGWDAGSKAHANAKFGFIGGAAAVTNPAAFRFKVTSSRTVTDAAADNLGITGGVTTDAGHPEVGATGYLNQTYIDPNTGVSFTLVDPSLAFDVNASAATDYGFTTVPSPAYQFRPGDTISLQVTADGVFPVSAQANNAVYGVKMTVPSTFGMYPADELAITTHAHAGAEPKVGDYYYLDLVVEKTEAEFNTLTYFTDDARVAQEYGDALPENKLSLGGKLMFLNGANLIAMKQVKKEAGSVLASDAAYIDAIASLKTALPGQDHKADVIVPLSTSDNVIQYLAQHLNTQASPRNKGEALGFAGLPTYSTETEAMQLATSLASERMVLIYPGAAIVSVEQNNVATPYAVGGEFLAAALAGLYLNPRNDVATDLTLQVLAGFVGLVRQTDEPVMDMLATSGLTVLTEVKGGLEIRQYVTTSTDNVLRIEPYVTSTVDYTRRRTRAVLKQFVAKKNIQNRLTDIAVAVNGLMSQLVEEEILTAYKPAQVVASKTDRRVVNVKVPINPMLSVLWINVTFNVSQTA